MSRALFSLSRVREREKRARSKRAAGPEGEVGWMNRYRKVVVFAVAVIFVALVAIYWRPIVFLAEAAYIARNNQFMISK